MKKLFIRHTILLLMICIQGCGLFEHTRRTKNTSEVIETIDSNRAKNVKSSYNKTNEILLYQTDSTHKVYDIRIKPTGSFFYSPNKGFKGTASEVLIKINEKHTKQLGENNNVSEHFEVQSTDVNSLKKRQAYSKTLTEVLKTPSLKWVFGGIVGFALLAFWLYKTQIQSS